MKNILCGLLLGLALPGLQAQEIDFEEKILDYGQLYRGEDGYREFLFTNIGDAPLLISDVRTSCGCTVADYPREAIAPGEQGKIQVKYDTKRLGAFNRYLIVYTNSRTEPDHELEIKGEIRKRPKVKN